MRHLPFSGFLVSPFFEGRGASSYNCKRRGGKVRRGRSRRFRAKVLLYLTKRRRVAQDLRHEVRGRDLSKKDSAAGQYRIAAGSAPA